MNYMPNESGLLLPSKGLMAGVSGTVLEMWAEKEDGSRRQLAGPFPNMILNSGINRYFTGGGGASGSDPTNGFPTYIYLSASNTPPSAGGSGPTSPVNIGGSLGAPSVTTGFVTAGGITYSRVRRILSATSTVGGAAGTWASIGSKQQVFVGNVDVGAASWWYSHSLIKDAGGSPTTITVLSTERINVTWAFDIYVPENSFIQNINLLGVDSTIEWKATSYSSWFGTASAGVIQGCTLKSGATVPGLNGSANGSTIRTTSVAHSAYTTDSFTRQHTFSSSTGSAGTMNGITLTGNIQWHGVITPGIVLTAPNSVQLVVQSSVQRASDLGIV